MAEADGDLLSIRRRIPRILFFYLASRGKLLGRDSLLPIFWEDDPETTARSRLREALSRLRSELIDSELLIGNNDLVGLDFNRIYVDQLDFQAVVQEVGQLPWKIPNQSALPAETYQRMLYAVNMWNGVRFMSGADLPNSAALETWVQQMDLTLCHQRRRFLDRLAYHAEAVGNIESALDYIQTALQGDETNEDLHQRYLTLLLESGQRSEARAYAENLEVLFTKEAIRPLNPELSLLCKKALAAPVPSLRQPEPDWRLRTSLRVPFVGRKPALDDLKQRLALGGGVFVLGESGQGKTRLLQEFSKRIAPQRRVLLAPCRAHEKALPFQPIIEMLRAQVKPQEWLNLPSAWLSRLTLILPELIRNRPGLDRLPPVDEHNQARSQLMEAVRQLLLRMAQNNPLVLFVDDAQWADEATLNTLAYLVEREPFLRQGLLVIAARFEETNLDLGNLLVSLRQSSQFKTIELTKLDQEEIAQISLHVLGYSPTPQFVKQLARETGGNPFFVLESLRTILDGQIQPQRVLTSSFPLTENLQALLQSRLGKLSHTARSVVELGAVLDQEFDLDLLSYILDTSKPEIAQAFLELQRRQLIEPTSGSPKELNYRFIHDMFREALLGELDPIRLRNLHKRIAETLEETMGPRIEEQAAILANHFHGAGNYPKAYHYWVMAGQRAKHLYSSKDAFQLFEEAEGLISRAEPYLSDEEILLLYIDWTELAFDLDNSEEIQRHNSRLLELGRERQSPLLIGAAMDGLSDACFSADRFEEGLNYANLAIAYLEKSDYLPKLMTAYIHRGVFLYMLGRVKESLEPFQQALVLGEKKEERRIVHARANAYYQIAFVSALTGKPEDGRDYAILSLEEASRLGDFHLQALAFLALSLSRYFNGEPTQARVDNQQGIEFAKRANASRTLGYLFAIRAMIELELGNLQSALTHGQQAISLGESNLHVDIVSMGNRMLGDLYMRIAQPEEALTFYQIGYETNVEGFWTFDNMFRVGYALTRVGKYKEGLDLLYQALALTLDSGLDSVHLLILYALASVYAHLKEWKEVEKILDSLLEDTRAHFLGFHRVAAELLFGIKIAAEGDLERALEVHRKTALSAAERSMTLFEIQALTFILQTEEQLGRSDPKASARRGKLLDQIERTIEDEQLLDAFYEFKSNLLP